MAVLVLAGVIVVLGQSSGGTPGETNTVILRSERHIVESAVHAFRYSSGRWMPTMYSTPLWEKYQDTAVGAAALGVSPGGTATERKVAIDTVNTAIAYHQLADGNFDSGPQGSIGSSVWGGFWTEAEGLIALTLHRYVPAVTLQKWEQSMTHYVDFLERTHQTDWYANGNVILRQSVIMLETYDLARVTNNSEAGRYWNDYLAERKFLVDPSAEARDMGTSGWASYGMRTTARRALWFDESISASPNAPLSCANGQTPCNGFDPNYTAAQLHDATIGYTVGGDSGFWGRVIRGEYNALRSRVSAGTLNASRGSRDNIASEAFYPPVYGILEQMNLGRFDSEWREQLNALAVELRAYEAQRNPGPNAYSLVMALAIPIIDARTVG